jgi:hypothetical protein
MNSHPTQSYEGKPTRKAIRLTKEQKAALVYPEDIQEVIIGMVISDGGGLELRSNNAPLRIDQKDNEFVAHLWTLFNSIGIVGLIT